jgi:RHS repeat-associated protein
MLPAKLVNNLYDSDMPTYRGFTDHEHLDEVALIHMNGRVYDYNLGRFLSVDPFIQSPTNSQSLNPYSYIMNNPLAGTDPTGYASKTETEDVKEVQTGSHIKRKTGTKTTQTVTDDVTGEVTNVTTATVMKNGSFTSNSVNYSNGKAESATAAGGNFKAGVGASASYEIGSQAEISQSSPTTSSEGRSVSGIDSEGNVYNWRQTSIYVGGPEGAWGAMQGAHNSGQGYDDWASSGGNKSLGDHPLVVAATWIGGEALASHLFQAVSMRLASVMKPYMQDLKYNFSFKAFRDGSKKLTTAQKKDFNSQTRAAMCGFVIACAAKFSHGAASPLLPTNPPAIRNGINYLHRWYDTTRPIMLQGINKK